MIVLYYEMKQGRKTPEYFRYVKKMYSNLDIGPLRLGYTATRIWEWNTETDSVRYIKNRYSGLAEDVEVDPKEFLMIQLAAKEHKFTRQI